MTKPQERCIRLIAEHGLLPWRGRVHHATVAALENIHLVHRLAKRRGEHELIALTPAGHELAFLLDELDAVRLARDGFRLIADLRRPA